MRIISTPLPTDSGTLGGPTVDDVLLSPTGAAVLERCSMHHSARHAGEPVIVAGVAQSASAAQRVRQVLNQAPPKALVLLVCATSRVYDAAVSGLGIDWSTTGAPGH